MMASRYVCWLLPNALGCSRSVSASWVNSQKVLHGRDSHQSRLCRPYAIRIRGLIGACAYLRPVSGRYLRATLKLRPLRSRSDDRRSRSRRRWSGWTRGGYQRVYAEHIAYYAAPRSEPQALGDPRVALGGGQSMTPPSEVIRRPSKAAEPFLRATAGKPNASIISTDIESVAQHVGVDRIGSTSSPKRRLATYGTPVSEFLLR
jgi:hypothetical protein